MEDARKLGERNWRNAARNRDSWQKLLERALVQKGLLCRWWWWWYFNLYIFRHYYFPIQHRSVFKITTECVYCAVRNERLYIIHVKDHPLIKRNLTDLLKKRVISFSASLNTNSSRYRRSVLSISILTFWRRNYFFFNFSTPVYKMWIIQEPNTLELWNKLHFEEEQKTEIIYHV